jgi:hypothetical protein
MQVFSPENLHVPGWSGWSVPGWSPMPTFVRPVVVSAVASAEPNSTSTGCCAAPARGMQRATQAITARINTLEASLGKSAEGVALVEGCFLPDQSGEKRAVGGGAMLPTGHRLGERGVGAKRADLQSATWATPGLGLDPILAVVPEGRATGVKWNRHRKGCQAENGKNGNLLTLELLSPGPPPVLPGWISRSACQSPRP